MRKSSLVISLVVGALLVPVAVFASHQFNDVPDSHIFHTGISWMKDNNITVGCNPPANTNYCPNDNVTRGEMATFMKRLAENKVVNAATATNADDANLLDGIDSTGFVQTADTAVYTSPVWGAAIDWQIDGQSSITGTIAAATKILDLTVESPGTGVLALNYTLGVFKVSAAYYGGAWLQYDNGTCAFANRIHASSTYFDSEADSTDDLNYVASTVVKSTTAGSHTISLCSGLFSGSPVTRNDASLVATFSATGVAPTEVAGDGGGGSADPRG